MTDADGAFKADGTNGWSLAPRPQASRLLPVAVLSSIGPGGCAIRDLTPFLPAAASLASAASLRPIADRAHVLLFGLIGWPWLLRSLFGGGQARHAALLERLSLPKAALPHLGGWKADAGYLHLVVDLILERRPRYVVEFGAGASTLVAARALQMSGGGKLITFDQNPEFAASTGEWLKAFGLEADIRAVPLAVAPADWPGLWYAVDHLPSSIDLMLIDGPPWTIHPFVRGSAEQLFARVTPEGTIMLDDGARPGERVVARRWRKKWPDFEFTLVKAGTKGTLVGRRRSSAQGR